MSFSNLSYPPHAFEQAIVFIDGTNLFNRLRKANLKVMSFYQLASISCGGRQILRVCIYTSEEKIKKAKLVHGENAFEKCRVIFGDSIKAKEGTREKGVDALLVADLVYHAATKNCKYAVVFSNDSDFVFAIKRVEDFGCKTSVVAVGENAPKRLAETCDDYLYLSKELLIERKLSIAL